ncbi:MAG: hypothetical protein WB245_13545 [Acidimicrobiia bacterium]
MSADLTQSRLRKVLPWLWLAMSLLWAAVIFVTDQLAWPLALWIATTVGPLTYLKTSKHQSRPLEPDTKGMNE